MASAAVTPRVRIMAICDRVRESMVEPGTYDLKRVRYEKVAKSFPLVRPRLWFFLLLSSPRSGEFPGYVVVAHDRTDKTIFFAALEPTPTFSEDLQFWPTRCALRCSFPEPGRYSVQVWFFREQNGDVLKGEFPILVSEDI
jgi:hypothetical protein